MKWVFIYVCLQLHNASITAIQTRRCTTVRDSEGQAIPCNGSSDGSARVMGKWSM